MKLEFKFGLQIAVTTAIWVTLEYWLGFHTEKIDMLPYASLLALIIPVVYLLAGLRAKKRLELGGKMRYSQCVKCGGLISAIAAVFICIYRIFYYYFINPDWSRFMIDRATKQLQEQGLSSEVLTQKSAFVETYFSLPTHLMYTFVNSFIVGLLITLILSAYLRTPVQSTAKKSLSEET